MIRNMLGAAVVVCLSAVTSLPADARTLCTMLADAHSGKVLLEQGECRDRVTPASTFKLALAVMGFDAGFLTSPHAPRLDYRDGDPDWGGEVWQQPTDPVRWLKYSVVWYSQRITHTLGAERLSAYAKAFRYGNADFSGDPGKNNGLERAWIMSSLKIAPAEQISFLDKLVNRKLPVAPHVFDEVERIVETMPPLEGWVVHGKTGTAFPRAADGGFDMERGYGWYVGWVVKDEKTLLFARLIQDEGQDETKKPGSPGVRARDGFITDLPSLVTSAP
jgi:beta-lactamase class D